MKSNKQNNKAAIIMGSQSDYPIMKDCEKILKILKIKYQALIASTSVLGDTEHHRALYGHSNLVKSSAENFFGAFCVWKQDSQAKWLQGSQQS